MLPYWIAKSASLLNILSFPAVIWQEWSVRVTSSRAQAGAPAVLTCGVPSALRDHCSVAAWYRDDAVLVASADDLAGPILLVDSGWRLILRSVRLEDARAQFACSVLDTLTGERRRSAPLQLEVTPSSGPSAPRALLHTPWEASVRRGADTVLPCLVHADPPPVVT
ncbi:hypothetical protein JYU34_003043 [Plutella xylostella]|uniref:Ig-like domain-containing protein n=1 Tax=Plutella xylostella TaxID=51655 RepID=A0ABQ7QZ60_PLUXY|nr:hypothetical protein JYU34_003043 [Plutella xylostella]